MLLEFDAEVVGLVLGEALSHQVVTDADLAFKKEVHVRHFVLLVQDESIFGLHVEL